MWFGSRNPLWRVVVADVEPVGRQKPVLQSEAPVVGAEEGVVERAQTGRRVSDRDSPLRERLCRQRDQEHGEENRSQRERWAGVIGAHVRLVGRFLMGVGASDMLRFVCESTSCA